MLGLGWLTLKQAQEAIRTGRLDEAQQLLSQSHIDGHKRGWELSQQLMRAYVARGEEALRQDDPLSAWNDLLKAEQLGITDSAPIRLRQELTRRGLTETRALLDAGEPARAVEVLAQLRQRAVRHADMDALEEAAKDWVTARESTERGDFAQALELLERVARLLPAHQKAVTTFQQKIEQRRQDFAPALVELHRAAEQNRWQEVLRLSEQLLEQAPQHPEVRRLRQRAWKAIEPSTVLYSAPNKVEKPSTPQENPSRRFVVWIDGVGGFLVCLDNRVTIGQAGPDCLCDIPLVADVSRMHATLTRDSEGYILEALRPVTVNNESVEKKLLQSKQRLTLGTSCQLHFRQDVPISASARLDLVSGHRFGQAVDGVILMAETLVLGPSSQVHVSLPVSAPLILYRHKEDIGIRSNEKIWINGQPSKDHAILEPGCVVSGADFSFAVESLGNSVRSG